MDNSGGYEEYAHAAEYYDHVVPTKNRPDIAFFVGMAKAANGPALEIACGTGRILIPTAKSGAEITGIDNSSRMLAICKEKLAREPEISSRVQLAQADMRHFDLGQEFNLVTIPFRSFQFLVTIEDQLACLNRVHQHLASNGTFILDIFNPSLPMLTDEKYLVEYDEAEFDMPDGRKIIRRHRTFSRDLLNQVKDEEHIYYVTHPDGREERLVHSFRMRYLFRFEAEHLLARAGFRVEEVYADYDKSPYGSAYPGELIFVAKKQ